MGLSLSASTIKSWFQYRCERKTRYDLMDTVDRASIPVFEDGREQKAWADLGMDFEKRVLARLGRDSNMLLPSSGEDGLSERLAMAFLRREKGATCASQMNLRPRQSPALLGNTPKVRVRRTYADLVQCVCEVPAPIFRVIDVKATRAATSFHKAQVAFYARMLESVLNDAQLPGKVDETGSIWRIPDNGVAEGDAWQADDFSLAPYLRLVDDFCARTLPGIAAKRVEVSVDETFFHIYFKCEQCEYLPHCLTAIDRAKSTDRMDISAVPGLTHEAKRGLHAVGVRTVTQLARAAGLRRMDGASWSLTRRAEALVVRAEALRTGAVSRTPEAYTFLMPPRADVGFYLVADHDPVDDGLVTLGYLKVENGQCTEHIEVLPNADRKSEADALVRVFSGLIADLDKIDRANQRADSASGIYSHIFFYEPLEAISLQNAVKRHLDDSRVRDGLLHMVRLFPPEEVVPEPEFRGMHHLPATALRSVLEQLYALPVVVSFDLRQVSCALHERGLIAVAYSPEAPFRREFSSLLSIEVSRGLRENRSRSVAPEAVENDVRERLQAMRAIVEWLQRENRRAMESNDGPMLRLAKKPFRFHATFDPLQAGDLDLLRALELLENRSGLLEALVRLAQPIGARRDARRCVAGMRLLTSRREGPDYRMVFDAPPESQDADLRPDSFGLILTDDDPDLRLNPALWSAVSCRLDKVQANDSPRRLRIRMRANVFDGDVFTRVRRRAGERDWCLDQSFVDFNSARADAFLSYLARGGGGVGT